MVYIELAEPAEGPPESPGRSRAEAREEMFGIEHL
jgi:hypothetical protein